MAYSRALPASAVATVLASAVEADQPQSELNALDFERKMKAALEPSFSSTRKLEIIIDNSSGAPVRRLAYQARVTAEDGTRKLLTVLSQPDSVRGTAVLVTQSGEQAGRDGAADLGGPARDGRGTRGDGAARGSRAERQVRRTRAPRSRRPRRGHPQLGRPTGDRRRGDTRS